MLCHWPLQNKHGLPYPDSQGGITVETTLIQTNSAPMGQHPSSSRRLTRPAMLILSRPPVKSSVKAIWDGFRMSKAWGEALETYDLPHE